MKTCKIRGIRHEISEASGFFSCVPLGCKHNHEHLSEGTAKNRSRESIDSAQKYFDAKIRVPHNGPEPTILLELGMKYSGWNVWDHLDWIEEMTGYNLRYFFAMGGAILIDDSCSCVKIAVADSIDAESKFIYSEY